MRRIAVAFVFLLAVPAASAHGPTGEPGMPVAGGKARIVMVGRMVRGTGFHASEHVRVTLLQGRAKRVARQVTVGARGTFVMLMAAVDRCTPAVVVAVGDDGSRATYRVPKLLC
jgi:hypothetical protein